MKLKLILLFFCYFNSFSQDHIHFVMIGEQTVIQEIEIEIIRNLVSIYNGKNNDKLTYQIDTAKYFYTLFDILESKKNTIENDSFVAISSISNTKERRKTFDFSSIYLPSKDVIFTLKSNKNIDWTQKGTRIAYQIKTTMEKQLEYILKSYDVVGVKYKAFRERFNALLNKDVEFSLADNVEIWNDSRVKIIHEMEIQSSFGISMMYPKGSKLKNRFDKYLNYYIKSPKFLMLIRNKFGKNISTYFRKNL